MFIFGEYTGFRCHKKYDGTHNIYQQMNLCLQLCSECSLGKLKKKVVNKFNPYIFLMSHRLSAVQIKVFGIQFMTGNTCSKRNW